MEFKLYIGSFGEEPGGGFCEENKSDTAKPGCQLIVLTADIDSIVRRAFVTAAETVQQGGRQRELFLAGFAQFTEPNISETNRIAMILQRNRLLLWMIPVRSALEPTRRTGEFYVILNQHPIVKNRKPDRRDQFA